MSSIEPTLLSPTGVDLERLDLDAVRATQRLVSRGFEAYLVGGCVRDLLLGREPKDFDIATSARPPQVKRTFPRNCRIIGRRFKLAHLHFDRNTKILEVSTFRRSPQMDGDTDLLIVRDNEFGDAAEDALRRDFTVNALFLDPTNDTILDYANGLPDIRAKVIRTIGDPRVRFREDPVRILRAAKFAGRLGFSIEPETFAAMAETSCDLVRAAAPRLLEEILRLLRGGHALDSFQLLRDVGALKSLVPVVAEFLASARHDQRVAFWRLLEALDHHVQQSSRRDAPLGNGVLLGVLCYYPVQARAEAEPERSPSSIAEQILGPLSMSLKLPRRDAGCLKRICGVQHRFAGGDGQKRFRVAGFVHGPYFDEAFDLFQLRVAAHDGDPADLARWQEELGKRGVRRGQPRDGEDFEDDGPEAHARQPGSGHPGSGHRDEYEVPAEEDGEDGAHGPHPQEGSNGGVAASDDGGDTDGDPVAIADRSADDPTCDDREPGREPGVAADDGGRRRRRRRRRRRGHDGEDSRGSEGSPQQASRFHQNPGAGDAADEPAYADEEVPGTASLGEDLPPGVSEQEPTADDAEVGDRDGLDAAPEPNSAEANAGQPEPGRRRRRRRRRRGAGRTEFAVDPSKGGEGQGPEALDGDAIGAPESLAGADDPDAGERATAAARDQGEAPLARDGDENEVADGEDAGDELRPFDMQRPVADTEGTATSQREREGGRRRRRRRGKGGGGQQGQPNHGNQPRQPQQSQQSRPQQPQQPSQQQQGRRHDGNREGRRRDRDRDRDRRRGGPRDVDVVPRSRDRRGKVDVIEPPPLDLSAFDVELDPKRVPTFGSIVEGKGRPKRRSPRVPEDGVDDYRPPPPPGSDAPPPPPRTPVDDPDTFGDW